MKLIIWCLLENQLVLFVHVEGMWGEWWREKFQSWLISVIVHIIRFFLTNSREAAFPLFSWKQSCQCTKSRGSLGMELKMTQGLCNNLEDPVISCFHGCTSLDSRSGREGKQFIVRMQFYWSKSYTGLSGALPESLPPLEGSDISLWSCYWVFQITTVKRNLVSSWPACCSL